VGLRRALAQPRCCHCFEFFLVADDAREVGRFNERRAARTAAGTADVAGDVPSDRVDEAVGWAQTTVIDANRDVESTDAALLGRLEASS
jgi:hypothetical protein